jgi:hypothetical protein
LTDCDVLNLPEKMLIPCSEKYKIRRILRHPYTIRVIITSDKLIWQVSHNSITSRTRQWAEAEVIYEERQVVCKSSGEMAPEIRADILHREELMGRWNCHPMKDGGESPGPKRGATTVMDEDSSCRK